MSYSSTALLRNDASFKLDTMTPLAARVSRSRKAPTSNPLVHIAITILKRDHGRKHNQPRMWDRLMRPNVGSFWAAAAASGPKFR